MDEHLALINNEPAPRPKCYRHRTAQPTTGAKKSKKLYLALYGLCYCVASVIVFVVVPIKVVNNFDKHWYCIELQGSPIVHW